MVQKYVNDKDQPLLLAIKTTLDSINDSNTLLESYLLTFLSRLPRSILYATNDAGIGDTFYIKLVKGVLLNKDLKQDGNVCIARLVFDTQVLYIRFSTDYLAIENVKLLENNKHYSNDVIVGEYNWNREGAYGYSQYNPFYSPMDKNTFYIVRAYPNEAPNFSKKKIQELKQMLRRIQHGASEVQVS